jgi:hypothetical protein
MRRRQRSVRYSARKKKNGAVVASVNKVTASYLQRQKLIESELPTYSVSCRIVECVPVSLRIPRVSIRRRFSMRACRSWAKKHTRNEWFDPFIMQKKNRDRSTTHLQLLHFLLQLVHRQMTDVVHHRVQLLQRVRSRVGDWTFLRRREIAPVAEEPL